MIATMEERKMSQKPETNPLVALSDTMADAVETAAASTVLVDARRRFPASGIAFAADLILTADHVVERDEEIRILLPDGSQSTATIAGRDPGSDLALLRLNENSLRPAQPAPQPARIGQLVLALGRPSPDGIQASLGVVSAMNGPVRTGRGGLLESYLRTDTTPYPGFSGGPLIDSAGRVLGINTSGLAQGMSLTIPAGLAWETAATLAQYGAVRRGYLGIRSQPVAIPAAQQSRLGREQASGLLLVGVEEGGPAEQAGLLVGDILVGLAGQPVIDPDDLLTRLVGVMVGQPTRVQVLRGGEPAEIDVIIGERK
jgi:S1-C subfamily serine protease